METVHVQAQAVTYMLFPKLGVQPPVGPDRVHCQQNDPAAEFSVHIVARLKPGVSLVQAEQDARRVADDFQRDHQDIYTGNPRLQVNVDPRGAREAARARLVLMALAGAVIVVLPTACANVMNLPASAKGETQRNLRFLAGETDLLPERVRIIRRSRVVFGPGRCSKLFGDRQRADPTPSGCPLDAGDPCLYEQDRRLHFFVLSAIEGPPGLILFDLFAGVFHHLPAGGFWCELRGLPVLGSRQY